MSLKEAWFYLTHPKEAVRAKLRQIRESGVQKEDWSEEDQRRIERRQRPQGIPNHRDL